MTYASTDNQSGQANYLYYTGIIDVTFFVRIPFNAVCTNPKIENVFNGPAKYGHEDYYFLEMQDNQNPAMPYGNGLQREAFGNINVSVASGMNQQYILDHADTWNYNKDGTGYPEADFQDEVAASDTKNDYPAGADVFLFSMDQTWHCMELTPPYNAPQGNLYLPPNKFTEYVMPFPQAGDFLPNVNDTALSGGHGSTHHVANYWGYGIRHYPGDPYPN